VLPPNAGWRGVPRANQDIPEARVSTQLQVVGESSDRAHGSVSPRPGPGNSAPAPCCTGFVLHGASHFAQVFAASADRLSRTPSPDPTRQVSPKKQLTLQLASTPHLGTRVAFCSARKSIQSAFGRAIQGTEPGGGGNDHATHPYAQPEGHPRTPRLGSSRHRSRGDPESPLHRLRARHRRRREKPKLLAVERGPTCHVF